MLSDGRAATLRRLATERLPAGEIAEVGVFRGGISGLLAQLRPDRRVYACDTFSGMPEECLDALREPYFTTESFGPRHDLDREETLAYLRSFSNLELCVGRFPDSASPAMRLAEFALVHLDCDLYRSTRDSLEFFWTRLAVGGAIVIDDCGRIETPGVAPAIVEFLGTLEAGLCQVTPVVDYQTSLHRVR